MRPVTARARRALSPAFIERFTDPEIRSQNLAKASQASLQQNRKLTRRQRRFVGEFLSDPARNAVQAAIRAGYKETTAYTMACEILKHPQVAAAIEEEDRRVFKKLEITQEKVLQTVAACAFSNISDYVADNGDVDMTRVTVQQASAIQDYSVEGEGPAKRVRLRLVDKLGALTFLGRHLKLLDPNASERPQLTINFLDKVVAGEISVDQLKQVIQVGK